MCSQTDAVAAGMVAGLLKVACGSGEIPSKVKDSSKILGIADWHYKTTGDAFIVYMNKDWDRLGDERFEYWESK